MLTGGREFQLRIAAGFYGRWRHREAGEQHCRQGVGFAERCRGGGAQQSPLSLGSALPWEGLAVSGAAMATPWQLWSSTAGASLPAVSCPCVGKQSARRARARARGRGGIPATAAFCACVGILGRSWRGVSGIRDEVKSRPQRDASASGSQSPRKGPGRRVLTTRSSEGCSERAARGRRSNPIHRKVGPGP